MAENDAALTALRSVLEAVQRAGVKTDPEVHPASAAWAEDIKWSVFAVLEDELEAAIRELELDHGDGPER